MKTSTVFSTIRENASAKMRILMSASLIALMALGGIASELHAQIAADASQDQAIPFTMKMETIVYSSNPRGSLLNERTIARNRRGDVVWVTTEVPHHPGAKLRSVGLLNGHSYQIFDAIRSVVKWPVHSAKQIALHQEQIIHPPAKCVPPLSGEYLAGFGKLLGHRVAIVKSLPKGSSGWTRWLAPELGCQELQSRDTQVQPDGSFKLISETRLLRLKIGPPNKSLFVIPAAYESVTPSQALRKMAARLGEKWNAKIQKQAQQEDAVYFGRAKAQLQQ